MSVRRRFPERVGAASAAALVLVFAGTLLAGCGGADGSEIGSDGADAEGGSEAGPQRRAVPVAVESAEIGSIARSVAVTGVVEPIRTVAVNSQVSGQLRSVTVEEGTAVRRGRTLATFDDRELRAQLEAAEAAYDVSEAAFQRAEQLHERQVITLPEYERDRTAYTAARAQRDQLRARIGYTNVTAPIDGVVTEKLVEAGDAVGVQTRLFSVADVSTLVVRVGVSEMDVVELTVGDPATVSLDAFPGASVPGRIRRVLPSADPSTRLVPVEVALRPDQAVGARPGFLARVTFSLDARDGVLLVPASAIVGGSGSQVVFVVEDGRAVRRTVSTGLTSRGRVEVVQGLEAGERVVVAGNHSLREGAPVRISAPDDVEGP